MLKGEDISSFQGGNFDLSGQDFGICKATEGTGWTDPTFAHNWARMKDQGVLRGAYHFGHPSEDAGDQARHFLSVVKPDGFGQDAVLVLDHEVTDGMNAAHCAAFARNFAAVVEALCDRNVWIYTMHSFIWGGYCAGLNQRPLWIAAPGHPGAPGGVAPWKVWTAHQYGALQGVDRNVFNGNRATWRALATRPQQAARKHS